MRGGSVEFEIRWILELEGQEWLTGNGRQQPWVGKFHKGGGEAEGRG